MTILFLAGLTIAILNLTTVPVLLWRYRPKPKVVFAGKVAILLGFAYLWLLYRLLLIPF